MNEILKDVASSQRIVVKVGTSSLTYDNGAVNLKFADRLAMVLSDLKNRGKEIILVSSGAQGVAMGKLRLPEKPKDTKGKQAIAAVGQCELMFLYDKMFGDYNNTVAQILLTREDIAIPRRKRNIQNTITSLLEMGIIPVINENDTVSYDEIEIGDNDTLSAVVADMVDADLLVMYSDIDGLYDDDPHRNKEAKLLPVVFDLDAVRGMAGGAGTKRGTGGMVTKIEAARIATAAGIHTVIANSKNIDKIYDILEGRIAGTLFVSKNFERNGE